MKRLYPVKTLSFIMVMLLLFSFVPFFAFAQEPEEEFYLGGWVPDSWETIEANLLEKPLFAPFSAPSGTGLPSEVDLTAQFPTPGEQKQNQLP